MNRQAMKHYRPGGLDPWVHNRAVARRKRYRRLTRQFRAAARSTDTAAASFRMLGEAARQAAESLRRSLHGLTTLNRDDDR